MTYIYIVPSCSLTACYGKSSLFIFVYKSHINGQFNCQRVVFGLSIGALLMGWPQEVEGGYLVELVFHSCTMDQIPVEESMRACSPFSGYTVQYCALLIWEESHHFCWMNILCHGFCIFTMLHHISPKKCRHFWWGQIMSTFVQTLFRDGVAKFDP